MKKTYVHKLSGIICNYENNKYYIGNVQVPSDIIIKSSEWVEQSYYDYYGEKINLSTHWYYIKSNKPFQINKTNTMVYNGNSPAANVWRFASYESALKFICNKKYTLREILDIHGNIYLSGNALKHLIKNNF